MLVLLFLSILLVPAAANSASFHYITTARASSDYGAAKLYFDVDLDVGFETDGTTFTWTRFDAVLQRTVEEDIPLRAFVDLQDIQGNLILDISTWELHLLQPVDATDFLASTQNWSLDIGGTWTIEIDDQSTFGTYSGDESLFINSGLLEVKIGPSPRQVPGSIELRLLRAPEFFVADFGTNPIGDFGPFSLEQVRTGFEGFVVALPEAHALAMLLVSGLAFIRRR